MSSYLLIFQKLGFFSNLSFNLISFILFYEFLENLTLFNSSYEFETCNKNGEKRLEKIERTSLTTPILKLMKVYDFFQQKLKLIYVSECTTTQELKQNLKNIYKHDRIEVVILLNGEECTENLCNTNSFVFIVERKRNEELFIIENEMDKLKIFFPLFWKRDTCLTSKIQKEFQFVFKEKSINAIKEMEKIVSLNPKPKKKIIWKSQVFQDPDHREYINTNIDLFDLAINNLPNNELN